MTDAFWVDDGYDRDHASNGRSRYEAYVIDAAFDPWTDDGQHVELAAFAWRRATGPVMSPGYVRRHPRILTAQLARSDWDGALLAQVDVITPKWQPLVNLRGPGDGWWSDWPSEFLFGSNQMAYQEPSGEDLARRGYMLASISLRFAVPTADLPQPRANGADFERCRLAVGVLIHELNVIVGPVLDRIEEN